MEGNTYRKPTEKGGDSLAKNANDWKSHQQLDIRKKVISKIVENLKRCFPKHSQNEINLAAIKFEDRAYGMSKDKNDYLLTIERTKTCEKRLRNLDTNNVQSGSSVSRTNTLDPASQVPNQRQSLPTSLPYTQTPTTQQWLPQNIQNNLNIPESSGLPTQIPITATCMAQNVNMDKRVHSNLLPGSQRQIQGSQQLLPQPKKSNYMLSHGNMRPPHMEQPAQKPQQQHHQQSLLEQTNQQSFPQYCALASLPSSGQQNSQFLPRPQFPTQRVRSSNQQQMAVLSQEEKQRKQERLISQLMNGPDTQQNHLTTRQNYGVSSSQQNNIASFQAIAQQNTNPPNMHQQRLRSHGTNASALPSQQEQNIRGGQSGNFNAPGTSLLDTQVQEVGQSQPMMFQQCQPQHPVQLPQKRSFQQNLDSVPNDNQRFQAAGSLRHTQNIADQQRTTPANPSTSQHSISRMGNATGGDWQEETYQKIKVLREMYLPVLSTMLDKVVDKLRQIDSRPPQKMLIELTEKLRNGKSTIEQVIVFLNVHRSNISEKHRDRFSIYEELVLKLTKSQSGPWRPMQQQEGMFPPSQAALQSQNPQVHVSQSLDNNQMNSQFIPSVSGLTTSHTATPHSLQTRPKIEPKYENNIVASLGNPQAVHSNINPVQSCMIQQPQQQFQQPLPQQQANQQLQMPTSHRINEMNDARMRQGMNIKNDYSSVPKPLASPPAQKSNFSPPQIQQKSSPQWIDPENLPTTVYKTGTPSQFCSSPFVSPSPVTSFPSEPITKRPIDRLITAVQSSSRESLAGSVREMSSVISLADRIAGSFHSVGGSRAGLAEDLSSNFLLQEGNLGETNPTKRLKRSFTTRPLDIASQTDILETEVESTASSASKDNKIEPSCALLKEINEINGRFVETVVDVCNEDVYSSEVTSGVIVLCSYTPVTLSETFQAHYKSGHISQIQPLRLLVPANYPYSSPILLEKITFDPSVQNGYEDLSARTRSRFGFSMKELLEPWSLKDIVQMWNDCARATMTEYAERYGGGTFSSKYGTWETVLRAS